MLSVMNQCCVVNIAYIVWYSVASVYITDISVEKLVRNVAADGYFLCVCAKFPGRKHERGRLGSVPVDVRLRPLLARCNRHAIKLSVINCRKDCKDVYIFCLFASKKNLLHNMYKNKQLESGFGKWGTYQAV